MKKGTNVVDERSMLGGELVVKVDDVGCSAPRVRCQCVEEACEATHTRTGSAAEGRRVDEEASHQQLYRLLREHSRRLCATSCLASVRRMRERETKQQLTTGEGVAHLSLAGGP